MLNRKKRSFKDIEQIALEQSKARKEISKSSSDLMRQLMQTCAQMEAIDVKEGSLLYCE